MIRNRSEKEIRDYLQKKNAEEAVIEKIVKKLYEQKFLNDESFAKAWILARSRIKPKGKYALKMELRLKGITDTVIEEVMNEISTELPSEIEQAKKIIKSRMQKYKNEERKIIYQKVGAFLARRGFSWEIAKKAIDAYDEA